MAQYRDLRLSEGVSSNTIRLELAVISHLYTVAIKDWGYETLSNPVALIRKPPLSKGRDRRLQPGELERLIDACRRGGSPYLEPMILIAIETAMRQGEIRNMQWKNIDLSKRVAKLELTKNGESREVPLTKAAVQIFSSQYVPGKEKVFDVSENAVKIAFRRACKRCGIINLRFHDLRHEATSRFFEMGLNEMEVSHITGHKTLQMLKRYTHLRPSALVKRLDGS